MYKTRLVEKTLKEAVRSFPAIFIGGPRRSGKTTLSKSFLKGYNYVLLDEIDVRSLAVEDPRGFLEKYPPPVIIDEIQNAPGLLSHIKARIEQNKKPGQWVLTGSQQWALMKGISETLAGRIAILHLLPFSLEEVQDTARLKLSDADGFINFLFHATMLPEKTLPLGRWILQGGYPEVVLNQRMSRKLWFSSYLQTYVDRDVRSYIKQSNLHDFERFVKLLAARTAQELNCSTLSRDIGVSVPTIKSWLTLLEASGIIFFLMPYHNNFGKRIIKAPKCYFIDTGIVSYLVGLQSEQHALSGPMNGALFETACVAQFYKRFSALADPCSLYYYRSTDGLEVDLLIETGKTIYPIEIKLSSTIDYGRVSSLKKWLEISRIKDVCGLVISTSKELGAMGGNVVNCHYSLI
ncbi:MAG TPA: ATP-binding protein [Candidatus Omnitrophota bacterium]|nr:ATP-binding protein [Candidatus Omnitrophota bacterium]HPD84173.1 ATP-binding protein [Candidatus Omnitrophota bacterium]HRZ03030.1 ATP-binding protein [Candidatus Omnitrophota bacterium]